MYRGFRIENLRFESTQDEDYFYGKGENVLYKYENNVLEKLESYIIGNNGAIDGTTLQNDWFPQVDCDVFISHSHNDKKLALALAGWLWDNFKLTSFIDSCIWGYANDLLKDIDDVYCRNVSSRTYNYNKRNYSTSHVHMMLNMALMQMIDKTECLFFLNTPNSICLDDIETCTLSPWIYSEIGISQMIEKKLGRRTRMFDSANESLQIKYKLNLSHLASINAEKLNSWKVTQSQGVNALDKLYEMIPAPRL